MFDQAHEDFLSGREYEQAAQDRARRATGTVPAPPRYMDHAQAHVLFTDRVMSWHRPVLCEGAIPMCTCGRAGRCCPYLELARLMFATRQLPWEPLNESEWGRP